MSTAAKISKEDLKEAIRNMTMVEMAELVKDLEEEFGVSASAPAMIAAMPGAMAGGAAEEVEEKTEFNVVLKSGGSNKINVIKEVRAITDLGLKEAKALVEEGNKVIKEAIPKEEAEEIKKKLEAAGAVVELT